MYIYYNIMPVLCIHAQAQIHVHNHTPTHAQTRSLFQEDCRSGAFSFCILSFLVLKGHTKFWHERMNLSGFWTNVLINKAPTTVSAVLQQI